jgi:hypothetical protein
MRIRGRILVQPLKGNRCLLVLEDLLGARYEMELGPDRVLELARQLCETVPASETSKPTL